MAARRQSNLIYSVFLRLVAPGIPLPPAYADSQLLHYAHSAQQRWQQRRGRLPLDFRLPCELDLYEYRVSWASSFLVAVPLVGPYIYMLGQTMSFSAFVYHRWFFGSPSGEELQPAA